MSDGMTRERMDAGARYYGALTLPLYDAAVLNIAVPFAWGISLREELAIYDRCVSARHLDIGVATGYFIKHGLCPAVDREITLMDLNPKATRYAAQRLRGFRVREVTGDAREPFPVAGPFDSIGMVHLLHCMPGTMAEKARSFDHAIEVLAPGGAMFGASVTPAGRKPNPLARLILKSSNATGALNNLEDRHEDLRAELERRFRDVRISLRGLMTAWEARDPR